VKEYDVPENTTATRYAIFEDGGKQYRAEEGALVRIDRKEAPPGTELTFDRVLLVGGQDTKVGQPTVSGASVLAVVEAEEKGPKVYGRKRRLHSRSETHWGHREKYTLLRVTKIVEG
jgi:large subunit ribosomal protein L21